MTLIEIDDIFGEDESVRQRLDELVRDAGTSTFQQQPHFTLDADNDQQAFIRSDARTIRLLAPAGSGKTQSIVNRILSRCTQDPKSLEQFLVLTFDNAAATSLREKLADAITQTGRTELTAVTPNIFTLNSFGYRLLRRSLRDHCKRTQMGNDSVRQAREIVREVLKSLRAAAPEKASLLPQRLAARVYVDLIGALKNHIVLVDELATHSQGAIDGVLHLVEMGLFRPWLAGLSGQDAKREQRTILNLLVFIYRQYEEEMTRRRRIDFDDQKLLPYLALRNQPELARAIMARFQSVIVDEFQDINRLDFELIQIIASEKQLIVVGDDDQAIYAFRGCSPDYIINFADRSGRAVDSHVLHTNYRCPRNIVEMGNRLIANNTNRVGKTQIAKKKEDADVQLWHSLNSASEAQIIARFVKRLHAREQKNGLRYSDIAVLLRMNCQSLPIQIAFAIEEIPFRCRPADNILVSQIMTNLLGLIQLHLHIVKNVGYCTAEDSELIARTLARNVTPDNIKRFHRSIKRCGGYVNASMMPGKVFMLGGAIRHWQFQNAIQALIRRAACPSDLINRITTNFRAIYGIVGTLDDALNDDVPLAELLDISDRFRGSIADFHEALTRLVAVVQSGLFVEENGDGVNLTTFFRAKGLQWHTVIIPTANQRVIPSSGSSIEDERRLFYVAVTRVKTNLVIAYVRQAVDAQVQCSQFIEEMGLTDATEKRATPIKRGRKKKK